MTTRRVLKYHK